jgi:hypothetical protein
MTRASSSSGVVDEDLAQERAEWRLQTGAWIVLALFVAAAAAGLFGSGPLSKAHLDSGPLSLIAQRFARRGAPTEVELRIARPVSTSGGAELSVWIEGPWLDASRIEQVTPPPLDTRLQPGRARFTFAAPTEWPLLVRLRVSTDGFGSLPFAAGLDEGPRVAFTPFVFP